MNTSPITERSSATCLGPCPDKAHLGGCPSVLNHPPAPRIGNHRLIIIVTLEPQLTTTSSRSRSPPCLVGSFKIGATPAVQNRELTSATFPQDTTIPREVQIDDPQDGAGGSVDTETALDVMLSPVDCSAPVVKPQPISIAIQSGTFLQHVDSSVRLYPLPLLCTPPSLIIYYL